MTMFTPSALRLFCSLAAFGVLASGCAIDGKYQGPAGPDAAKLRFISKLDSATLTLFDAEHCEGQNTGLLNNLFTANTVRRTDMKVAAPADAGPYIEVRLTPGKEQLLRSNMLTTGYVGCTSYTNLTPQPGAEYELTLSIKDRKCVTALTTLHQLDGKVSRLPLPIVQTTLPACAGKNPAFPAFKAQPDTPARTAMIDRIIADSIIPAMTAKAEPVDTAAREVVIAKQVDERKKLLDFTMPEDYWNLYRKNLESFHDALDSRQARSFQFYQDDSRKRLRSMDTDELSKLVERIDEQDPKALVKYSSLTLGAYTFMSRRELREDFSVFNASMAELDRRYGVCDRYVDCWRN